MALVQIGDRTKTAQVADDLVASDSHTIRYCAALTLRLARDRTSLAALRKALRDPYQREDASCLHEGMVYPVRIVVADALIDLGEDPATIRKEQRQE
jgi:HEAT repeat protein